MFKKLLALTATAALLLTACASPAEDPNGPITIGSILPLTGDGAAYGLPLQTVAQIAVEEINANGGVNGRELNVIWEDGKCSGKDATAAAQKLINADKVKVILGGLCSSETLGFAPLAETNGVLVLSPASSSPDITSAGDYIFRNYPSDSSQGKILANIAIERGYKKVGMLTEENDYTLGIEKAFSEAYATDETEFVSESFLATDTDFKTQLTKLKGGGIDALFINPQTPPKADLILKQLQDLGTDGLQLFANDVITSYGEGLSRYPELVEGLIGAETGYNADDEGFKYFTAKYQEKKGEEAPFLAYSAATYDAVYLLKAAIEAVGHDADAIKGWLYNVKDWQGAAGSLTIDANGDPTSGHQPRVVKAAKATPYTAE